MRSRRHRSESATTQASSLHELKTLILSFHPLIVIESAEEDRVRQLVAAATRGIGLDFLEWSITRGLRYAAASEAGGDGLPDTESPVGMLRALSNHRREGVFLLADLAAHLSEASIERLMADACRRFSRTSSALVLVGSSIELPPGLEPHAAYLRLELPDRDELRAAVRSVLGSLHDRQSIRVRISAEDKEGVLDALRGLTLNQARQAVAYAVLEDGVLSGKDIETVLARKALPPEMIRKGRFDEIFFVDLPKSDERASIFEIHLRRRKQEPARFQLDDLVLASAGFSGAEIEQVVIAALYRALHEKRPLDDALLLREIDATVPLSVSRSEAIDQLRELARERFVPVSSGNR